MIHFLTNVATDFEVEEVNVTEEDLEDLRESGGKVANWKEVRLSLSCRVLLPVW
jgi:hypothetical protein